MIRCLQVLTVMFLWLSGNAKGQAADPSRGGVAKVGILLDISAEMGFVVPRVRKELRLINRELQSLGRESMPIRELKGASLDREVTLSIPARLNALHSIRALYEEDEVDTVYWITALKGRQSVGGLFAVENEIKKMEEGRPPRKLVIRNVWQDQLQRSAMILRRGSELEDDPLSLKERPESWYRLVGEDRGVILRSWQAPPRAFREQFGFPWRVRNGVWMRLAQFEGNSAEFDTGWAQELFSRHQLRFARLNEDWLYYFEPHDWITRTTLLPFPDEKTAPERGERLFNEMFQRDPIEKDLAAIEAEKLGVLFAFGYVRTDLNRFSREENRAHPFGRFIADTIALVRETREHQENLIESAGGQEKGTRLYATEMIEVENQVKRPPGPDRVAKRIADFVRKDEVDAIYLFSNGYSGGSRYGICTIDQELLALAIREAGVKLYVRIPFETASAPISLERLALASGGAVFRGRANDPDWKRELPSPRWPAGAEEEKTE